LGDLTRRRIIIIIIRNGAKTISLQTLFGRLNYHRRMGFCPYAYIARIIEAKYFD
jgi:hypothetical protein